MTKEDHHVANGALTISAFHFPDLTRFRVRVYATESKAPPPFDFDIVNIFQVVRYPILLRTPHDTYNYPIVNFLAFDLNFLRLLCPICTFQNLRWPHQ